MSYRITNQICLAFLLLLVVALGLVPTFNLKAISDHNDELHADIEEMAALHVSYDAFQETALAFDRYIRHGGGDPTALVQQIDANLAKAQENQDLFTTSAMEQPVMVAFIRNMRLFRLAVDYYFQEQQVDPTGDGALQMEKLSVEAKRKLSHILSGHMEKILVDIKARDAQMYHAIGRSSNYAIVGLILGSICGLLIAIGLGRSFSRPIGVLTDGAHKIGTGDFDHRITLKSFSEFNLLAKDLNAMADHLQAALTEEKKMTTELSEKNTALQRAARLKSEFLANMSHEIRTPLNGVVGMAELLAYTQLTNEQNEYVETIGNSSTMLLALVNDILDYSKIEAGRLELEIIDFDLREVMDQLGEIMALKAHEKDLELVAVMDREVSSGLRGDPYRLRQILTNLCSNAIKFTEKGEVAIRVSLEDENDNHATLRFSVMDTGVGIPEDRRHRLFQSFSQVDGSTTRKYGGSGLGLIICKQLLEMMGGNIGLNSTEGKGSEFWFILPFEKQINAPSTEFIVPESIQEKRILIVDDNATNRLVLREQLKWWGCCLDEASSAAQAMDKLHGAMAGGDPFHIAIIDMQMPGMDGKTLGQKIKQDDKLKKTRMVMMTSMGGHGDAAEFKAIGFDAYLVKPVKQSELYDCLTTVVGYREVPESAPVINDTIMSPRTATQCAKFNLLLVEDNPTNQKLALAALKKLGYGADVVTNGRQAIEALGEKAYDLVLMDCQMPVMDGYEATRMIRSNGIKAVNPNVPIVAMTAHAMKGDREKCLLAGMDDYMAKPIQLKVIAATLDKWLPGADKHNSPESMDIASPKPIGILDYQALADLVGGDTDVVRDILNGFLTDLPVMIAEIKDGLHLRDAAATQRGAHTLKGSSANVRAKSLEQLARRIEAAAQSMDLEKAAGLVDQLQEQLELLQKITETEQEIKSVDATADMTQRNYASPDCG